jgi:hypothetical protein
LRIYNKAFEAGKQVDKELREQMYQAALRFRAANREFEKLKWLAEKDFVGQ